MKSRRWKTVWARLATATALGAAAASPLAAEQFRYFNGRRGGAPPCNQCQIPYAYPCPQAPLLVEPQQEGSGDEATSSPDGQTPSFTDPGMNIPAPAPQSSFSSLSGATGTPSAPGSATPNMIGDTLGGSCGTAFFQDDTGQAFVGGGVNHPNFNACSRQKIAENNSPMPRNRVYFTYNHFHNPINNFAFDEEGPTTEPAISDTHVDRFTVGFEKTFLYDVFSLEVRVPAAYQLGTNMAFDFSTPPAVPSDRDLQLGNVAVALKSLLYSNANGLSLSGGLLLETPTSEDVRIRTYTNFVDDIDGDGTFESIASRSYFEFQNEAVFLSPFLAFLYAPDAPFFVQGFWQTDFPLHGSDLAFELRSTADNGATQGLRDSVHFDGDASMRFDLGAGVYLYRDTTGRSALRSLAFLVEAHFSTTIQDTDLYSVFGPFYGNQVVVGRDDAADILLGNVSNRVHILNLTFGPTAILQNGMSIASGFVVPTDSGDEKPFDFEFQLQINQYF